MEFGAPHFLHLVEAAVNVVESTIDIIEAAVEVAKAGVHMHPQIGDPGVGVAQTRVVDQNADEHRDDGGRRSQCDGEKLRVSHIYDLVPA